MDDVHTFDQRYDEHGESYAPGIGRWGWLAAGSAMVLYGLSRRSATGVWMAAAGTPLVYRGLRGPQAWRFGMSTDTRVALGGPRGTHVRHSAPVGFAGHASQPVRGSPRRQTRPAVKPAPP